MQMLCREAVSSAWTRATGSPASQPGARPPRLAEVEIVGCQIPATGPTIVFGVIPPPEAR